MAISVADNFSYQGGKPLDARMKFDTVALMVATPAASLYDGCFAYVKATKKYYSYDSANETDPTLGKWVEYSSGDAPEYDDFTGATSEAAGVHGLVPAPAIADIEKFLKGDGTWADVPLPLFDYSNTSPDAMNFSTDEKVIGTWVDGKPLYQKTYTGVIGTQSPLQIAVPEANSIDKIVNEYGICIETNGATWDLGQYRSDDKWHCFVYDPNDGYIKIPFNGSVFNGASVYVTLRYTKTTDTAVASGEKIIGQWIDGKPIYRKVVTGLNLKLTWSGQYHASGNMASPIADVDKLVFAYAIASGGNVVSGAIKIVSDVLDIVSVDDYTITTLVAQYTKTTS